jgi:hypothetical protein
MNTASRLTLNFGVSDKGMMVYDTTLSNVMFWNGTVWVPLGGGGLVPVGASLNTEVIYNNAGVLEGDTGLTFNNATNALTVVGPASVQGLTVGKGNGAYATNTAFGSGCLAAVTADSGLLALGSGCMPIVTSGSQNVGVGNRCLEGLTLGASNTAMGTLALATISTQDENTAIGRSALISSVGGQNTAIGYSAGGNHLIGSNNAFFGANAQPSATTISNEYTYGGGAVLNHRFVNGNVVLGAGNVVVASAQGIDFSATAGTGTSELLADYEEGTWTPTDSSGAALAFVLTKCRYTKIGRAVTIQGRIQYPITVSAAPAGFQSFPFVSADMLPLFIAYDGSGTIADSLFGLTTFVGFYLAGTPVLNSALSGVAVNFSGTYMT